MGTESVLMSIEEQMLILTPDLIRAKIEEHERHLKLWQALLVALEPVAEAVSVAQVVPVVLIEQEQVADVKTRKPRRTGPSIQSIAIDYLRTHHECSAKEIAEVADCSYAVAYAAMQREDATFVRSGPARFRLRNNGIEREGDTGEEMPSLKIG